MLSELFGTINLCLLLNLGGIPSHIYIFLFQCSYRHVTPLDIIPQIPKVLFSFYFSNLSLLGAGDSACNPSYSGARDQEDSSSKPAQDKKLERPFLKNTPQKRVGGVAQVVACLPSKCEALN
jgi:hypothetical protein